MIGHGQWTCSFGCLEKHGTSSLTRFQLVTGCDRLSECEGYFIREYFIVVLT